MAEISKYFIDLARSKEQTSGFENDLGVQFLAKGLEYKIDQTQKKIQEDVREMYSPRKKGTLLAYNLNKSASIYFKKPLIVKAKLLSDKDITLPKSTRFSDGNDVFYSVSPIIATKDIEQGIVLVCEIVTTQTFLIEEGKVFSYFDTGYKYDEIHKIKVVRKDKELNYSQNFIDWEGDYSLEIDPKTEEVSIVALLENERGNNLKTGDTLMVEVHTTSDLKEVPAGLMIIDSGYDLVIKNIEIQSNYSPPLTTKELIDNFKHTRYTYGDIVFNENFKQLIEKKVTNIELLKVWQEREQTLETGYNTGNINKVFISYVDKSGNTANPDLEKQISQTVFDAIHGRMPVFKQAEIIEIGVAIEIKTNEPYPQTINDTLRGQLLGYYDDINSLLNETSFYGLVFTELKKVITVFELSVRITDKGQYRNRKIFHVGKDKVSINVATLGMG